MFRTIVLRLLAVAFIALLVACGDSQESISVTVTDLQLEPDKWTVSAGNEVKVSLTNNSSQDQECVLLKQGVAVTAPFDADDEDNVFWKIEAEPGEIESETLIVPGEPGAYDLVCGNPSQLEQGMQGTLVVE